MESRGRGSAALRPDARRRPGGRPSSRRSIALRAALEDPENVACALTSSGGEPLVTVPFGPVHARYSACRPRPVASRSTTRSTGPRRHPGCPGAPPLHPASLRPCPRRRVPGPQPRSTRPRRPAVPAKRDLFVVGDDDQLIYGWRFADPDGILRFHERLPPTALVRDLHPRTNYRCSRPSSSRPAVSSPGTPYARSRT